MSNRQNATQSLKIYFLQTIRPLDGVLSDRLQRGKKILDDGAKCIVENAVMCKPMQPAFKSQVQEQARDSRLARNAAAFVRSARTILATTSASRFARVFKNEQKSVYFFKFHLKQRCGT